MWLPLRPTKRKKSRSPQGPRRPMRRDGRPQAKDQDPPRGRDSRGGGLFFKHPRRGESLTDSGVAGVELLRKQRAYAAGFFRLLETSLHPLRNSITSLLSSLYLRGPLRALGGINRMLTAHRKRLFVTFVHQPA